MDKTCRDCGERKPVDDFYRAGTGYLPACKVCHRARMRQRHHEKMRDPSWREAERARSRKKAAAHGASWDKPNATKRAAQVAVGNAVRDRRIVPAARCADCGHDFTAFRREAHHPDYSKPLDVEWLCSLCHGKRHRKEAA